MSTSTPAEPKEDGSDNAVIGRILDAALRRFEAQGISGTTMAELASDAGISRAWLYRQFQNREAVLRALVTRENKRLVSEIANAAAAAQVPFPEQVTQGFVQAVRVLRGSALLRRVLISDREAMAPYLIGESAPALRNGTHVLATALTIHGLTPARAKRVSETLVRLVFSIVTTSCFGVDFDNPRELRAYAAQIVQALLA